MYQPIHYNSRYYYLMRMCRGKVISIVIVVSTKITKS